MCGLQSRLQCSQSYKSFLFTNCCRKKLDLVNKQRDTPLTPVLGTHLPGNHLATSTDLLIMTRTSGTLNRYDSYSYIKKGLNAINQALLISYSYTHKCQSTRFMSTIIPWYVYNLFLKIKFISICLKVFHHKEKKT